MINIILEDQEDDCAIQVSISTDCTGAIIFCTDTFGNNVELIVDVRLLKQLCAEVSKAIKSRAQKNNECGYVKQDTLEHDQN
jgi:hypothetical protein